MNLNLKFFLDDLLAWAGKLSALKPGGEEGLGLAGLARAGVQYREMGGRKGKGGRIFFNDFGRIYTAFFFSNKYVKQNLRKMVGETRLEMDFGPSMKLIVNVCAKWGLRSQKLEDFFGLISKLTWIGIFSIIPFPQNVCKLHTLSLYLSIR